MTELAHSLHSIIDWSVFMHTLIQVDLEFRIHILVQTFNTGHAFCVHFCNFFFLSHLSLSVHLMMMDNIYLATISNSVLHACTVTNIHFPQRIFDVGKIEFHNYESSVDLAKVVMQHRQNIYLKIIMLTLDVKIINILTVFFFFFFHKSSIKIF